MFKYTLSRLWPLEERIKEVENSLKLRNLSKTRCTVGAESICVVWMSYEIEKCDSSTMASATDLRDKMGSADFVMSIMLTKTKQMREALQGGNLIVVDAMTIIMTC